MRHLTQHPAQIHIRLVGFPLVIASWFPKDTELAPVIAAATVVQTAESDCTVSRFGNDRRAVAVLRIERADLEYPLATIFIGNSLSCIRGEFRNPPVDVESGIFRVNVIFIRCTVNEQLMRVMTAPEVIANLSRMTGIEARRISEIFNKEIWTEMTNGEKQRLAELLIERALIAEYGLTLEIKTGGVKSMIEEAMYATDKD